MDKEKALKQLQEIVKDMKAQYAELQHKVSILEQEVKSLKEDARFTVKRPFEYGDDW